MDSPIMRETAATITRGASSEFEKVERIHDFVTSTIRYVRDDVWDPAAAVLARGTGSCSEYNYLFSGLCRLSGIPTRYVGGSTNGRRPLPTTDAVFHRWTEVFLDGVGWFPVDCSRDANPARGKRSHFGRVYTDALVWCCQTGDPGDYLGWEYRAAFRTGGLNILLVGEHRTRWYALIPEKELEAAHSWLLAGGEPPRDRPDVLECALLAWEEAPLKNRGAIVEALAAAGRPWSLCYGAMLPREGECRAAALRKLCADPAFAADLLGRSARMDQFLPWFRKNEAKFAPAAPGAFSLSP
jgi:hypothetical protein